MEMARLQSRNEAASAAAQELEARAHASAAASAGATASAQQALRDAQAKVAYTYPLAVLTGLCREAFREVGGLGRVVLDMAGAMWELWRLCVLHQVAALEQQVAELQKAQAGRFGLPSPSDLLLTLGLDKRFSRTPSAARLDLEAQKKDLDRPSHTR